MKELRWHVLLMITLAAVAAVYSWRPAAFHPWTPMLVVSFAGYEMALIVGEVDKILRQRKARKGVVLDRLVPPRDLDELLP